MDQISILKGLKESGKISAEEYSKRLAPLVDAIAGLKSTSS